MLRECLCYMKCFTTKCFLRHTKVSLQQALYWVPSIFHACRCPLMLLGRWSDLYLSKDEEMEQGEWETFPSSIRQREELELEPSSSGWTALVRIRMFCSCLIHVKWNIHNYLSKHFPRLVALISVTVSYGRLVKKKTLGRMSIPKSIKPASPGTCPWGYTQRLAAPLTSKVSVLVQTTPVSGLGHCAPS